MKILGISAFYHDSAAALIIDGEIISAIEEERFSRIKHDNQFPFQAIDYCLRSLNLNINQIDYVTYYEKPLLKFERLLDNFVTTYPYALKPFTSSLPEWLGQKIKIDHLIKNKLGYLGNVVYIPHHTSHQASAFYTSPFNQAAILTIDGVGEYQTTTMSRARNGQIEPLSSINFPHSIGLLYSTFTAFLGFKVNEDEYKLMGLSAYGKPTYQDAIKQIVDLKPDGSFKLNLRYFSFRENFQMWNDRFEKIFGPPRNQADPITTNHQNISASIQAFTEDIIIAILNHLQITTKEKNLCVSGGVGLNALANGKIFERTNFKQVHIFGASGDSGSAIGAALFWQYLQSKNTPRKHQPSLCLGTSYSKDDILTQINLNNLKYSYFSDESMLIQKIAYLLGRKKVIGWFQNKCEFGPRALGARSILASPYPRNMKDVVNKIKHREQFRPFAGSVLQEQVHNLFEVPQKNFSSPYMNFCFKVKPSKQNDLAAIVHQDETCRIQTVSKINGLYYHLIKEFYHQTGIPCILNTSFNVMGEPIVEHPAQAIKDFLTNKIHYLAIGNYLIKNPNYIK